MLIKLSASTADYFESAHEDLTIPPLDSSYGNLFTDRIRAKSLFYYSLAQFFKAQELNKTCVYGEEISRLSLSFDLAKKAIGHLKVLPLDFEEDITSHAHRVDAALKAAMKDNNMIYHEKIPDHRSLSPLPRAALVNFKFPPFLEISSSENSLKLFETLIPYNIKLASDAYIKKRDSIISSIVTDANEHEEFVKAYGLLFLLIYLI